jgi:hypothetical protein
MSEIKKYQKAMNFKANPRYLTRDFIVPLYTGTEPDILDDSNTQRETGNYTPFPNDMPIVSPKEIQNQPYEQLQLADGGRANFSEGSKLTGTDKTLEQNIKEDHKAFNDYRKSIGQSTIPLDNAFIKMWQRTRLSEGGLVSISDFSRQQKSIGQQAFQKYLVPSQINSKGGKDLVNALSKSGIVFSDKKGPYGERYLKNVNKNTIKNFEKNIKNIREYVEVPSTIIKNNVVVGVRWPNKDVEKEYINQIKERSKYSKNSNELQEKIKSGKILSDSQLAKKFGMNYSEVVRINSQIKKDYDLERPVIGRDETRKQVDIKRKEAQLKFSEPGFEKKYSGTYKAHLGHMGDLYNRMVTSKNLGYTPAEINDAMKETLDPILKNISQAQDKLIKNKPPGWKQKLEEYNKKGINYSSLAEGYKSFDITDPDTLKKYTYGVDYLKTIDPAALYEGKPIKEISELTDKREINKIQKAFDDLTEVKKIARTEGLEQADISKIKNSELLTEENLKKLQNYSAFEQNKEEVLKAQTKVTAGEKRKVINNLTNYLNKNPEEVKAFRAAGVVCKRSVGGKVDTECLAENIIKETEKLETGTDLQKTSALNKFKNATKLGAGLAEEVIGFGKGAAGRTLGPLVALNSALEQFTSGNYREGIRKIADVADLTTLVGDPLGFEKMRTEGTIEDVRGKIGKENQASLDRILEFKDKYYQLQDINTKLQRAESATQDPNAAPESYDPNYLNELKKQQIDLDKIINSPKYQNIRTDYLNVGNAVKNEIFKRNINAPEQNKYTFETAAQEQLKSILGYDFYDELSDENKIIFKNLTASEKIKDQPVPFETPIQSPDDSMREGFAEGGGPKMGRRGFLGLLTGIAAAPELIKSIKGTKKAAQIAKVLPKVSGMPEWFSPLVNKIMKEGVDVSPKVSRLEDFEIVKKLEIPSETGKPEVITLTQNKATGNITIESNVGGVADSPFELQYSPPKSDINLETGKEIKYPGEFYVVENRPRPVGWEGSDLDFDYDTFSIDEAFSDVERLEKIGTGKIEDIKKVEQRAKGRKMVYDSPYDDVSNRFPEPDVPDWWEYNE